MSSVLKDRVKSEARAGKPIRNEALVCRDCLFRFDDSEIPANTGTCDVYPEFSNSKPNEVLCGGDCEYYEKEE